ncbi:methyltransferase domain-containing protein [Rhodobacterales bacterium HKCCE3408]|nr:methyltransferase domain-containing protein [Rhodobacterales bacterium HKCCE3408]
MTHKAFFLLHRDLPREGPGERGDVSWAAEVAGLRPDAAICDAACGPGADIPALLFAAPHARVVGFDLHAPFVDDAAARFESDPRVTVMQGRLVADAADDLPDPAALGPFDFLWCAGAAYFVGLRAALRAWAPALAPGGHVAFSEAVWLTDDPAPEAQAFWAGYAAMTDADGIAGRVAEAGWETVATRVLSDAAWEGYFGPMERRIAALRPGADAELAAVLDEAAEEARIWRTHRRDFGYLLSVVRPA